MKKKAREKKPAAKKDDMRDRMDRPTPQGDTAEGDEQVIDEALRQHEHEREPKKRTA
ncbi:MAG TPA: hypothetical protein VN428_17800 [Bryobacteraceae bacterium]|nr:hypothetical protein [Bryobacteraceae bacterium]